MKPSQGLKNVMEWTMTTRENILEKRDTQDQSNPQIGEYALTDMNVELKENFNYSDN